MKHITIEGLHCLNITRVKSHSSFSLPLVVQWIHYPVFIDSVLQAKSVSNFVNSSQKKAARYIRIGFVWAVFKAHLSRLQKIQFSVVRPYTGHLSRKRKRDIFSI